MFAKCWHVACQSNDMIEVCGMVAFVSYIGGKVDKKLQNSSS
jgi:hypothetical protein